LQLKTVQKAILNMVITADFEKISGVVPFKFSLHNLKVGDISVNTASLVLDRSLMKIKNISAETVDIKTSNSELDMDIAKYILVNTKNN
jgi:hypothetical protein